MIKSFVGILVILSTLVSFSSNSAEPTFDIEKDLLLLNFDLKTDVDDVHTIAALDLILLSDEFKNLNYFLFGVRFLRVALDGPKIQARIVIPIQPKNFKRLVF